MNSFIGWHSIRKCFNSRNDRPNGINPRDERFESNRLNFLWTSTRNAIHRQRGNNMFEGAAAVNYAENRWWKRASWIAKGEESFMWISCGVELFGCGSEFQRTIGMPWRQIRCCAWRPLSTRLLAFQINLFLNSFLSAITRQPIRLYSCIFHGKWMDFFRFGECIQAEAMIKFRNILQHSTAAGKESSAMRWIRFWVAVRFFRLPRFTWVERDIMTLISTENFNRWTWQGCRYSGRVPHPCLPRHPVTAAQWKKFSLLLDICWCVQSKEAPLWLYDTNDDDDDDNDNVCEWETITEFTAETMGSWKCQRSEKRNAEWKIDFEH